MTERTAERAAMGAARLYWRGFGPRHSEERERRNTAYDRAVEAVDTALLGYDLSGVRRAACIQLITDGRRLHPTSAIAARILNERAHLLLSRLKSAAAGA